MMHKKRLANAMTLSRGLKLGRAIYRLWHFCLGLLAFSMVGLVVAGQVKIAIGWVVGIFLIEYGIRWLARHRYSHA